MNIAEQAVLVLETAPTRSGMGGRTVDGGAAWRRELERAQSARWFLGPVLSGAAVAAANYVPGRHQDMAAAVTRSVGRTPSMLPICHVRPGAATPMPSHASLPLVQALHAGPMPLTGDRHATACWLASEVAHADAPASAAEPAASAARPQRCASRDGPDTPVRVHVEPGPAGAAVWLGLDARACAVSAQLPELVAELRRQLLAAGQHLASVVCNGSTVHADPLSTLSSKESP